MNANQLWDAQNANFKSEKKYRFCGSKSNSFLGLPNDRQLSRSFNKSVLVTSLVRFCHHILCSRFVHFCTPTNQRSWEMSTKFVCFLNLVWSLSWKCRDNPYRGSVRSLNQFIFIKASKDYQRLNRWIFFSLRLKNTHQPIYVDKINKLWSANSKSVLLRHRKLRTTNWCKLRRLIAATVLNHKS